jgi:ribosome modulation factor
MNGCAYYQGYWMAQEGAGLDANPYNEMEQSVLWLGWRDGWEDAQEERQPSDR